MRRTPRAPLVLFVFLVWFWTPVPAAATSNEQTRNLLKQLAADATLANRMLPAAYGDTEVRDAIEALVNDALPRAYRLLDTAGFTGRQQEELEHSILLLARSPLVDRNIIRVPVDPEALERLNESRVHATAELLSRPIYSLYARHLRKYPELAHGEIAANMHFSASGTFQSCDCVARPATFQPLLDRLQRLFKRFTVTPTGSRVTVKYHFNFYPQ